ncbi:MAG: T9SS type A sorting domain-containing protein [Bacteroidota bacterium]
MHVNTLNIGDAVEQQAEIYFDYNFPIITNIAQTNYQALFTDEFVQNDVVKIYPNPAKNFVNLESSSLIESLKLYDIQGRLTFQQNLNSTETSINVSNYKSGIYFIGLYSAFGIMIQRLIKN